MKLKIVSSKLSPELSTSLGKTKMKIQNILDKNYGPMIDIRRVVQFHICVIWEEWYYY